MTENKYGLYKRIMKRDPKAIDEIETLEEAKEILKMVMGNTYMNGETYNFDKHLAQKIKAGSKIFCEGQRACLKLEEELNNKGIETRVGCNEAGMWSIYKVVRKAHSFRGGMDSTFIFITWRVCCY